jgi:hypothetical protein
MERSWYHIAKECTAIRKNVLRVDLCVFIDKEEAFSNEDYLNSTIKSILTSAIINGLDIVGILSPDAPYVGLKAKQMAQQQQMDLVVVSGQTYKCSGKEELYIYNLLKPVPMNLSIDKACGYVHDNNGFVLATNVNSKLAMTLNRLQGSKFAPDGVEIFNAKSGGYRDVDIDFPRFVNSGSTSANELDDSNVFTLMQRKTAQEMGFLQGDEGVDFTPKYLKPQIGVV